jgi:cytochrome c peroxidase
MTLRVVVFLILTLAIAVSPLADEPARGADELASLGRLLFFDARFSADRGMSCATCHDPARAFTDTRENAVDRAASFGHDGTTLGRRNAPALTYAALTPDFHEDGDGIYVGGFFHDGRASNLVAQAQQPVTSPQEMGLTAAEVQARLREEAYYVEAFERLLGTDSLASPDGALKSFATAIAAFESSAEFSSFDSRYDRYLRGEATLTRDEELGRRLFFSPLSNCGHCHLVDRRENTEGETFTAFEYYNIGVPANEKLLRTSGRREAQADPGLAANPAASGGGHDGKFRVPSLRNVAVTGPYMHNGVFSDLTTAIVFYNRFLVDNEDSRTNPETGTLWGEPEQAATIELSLLSEGQPLSPDRVRQIEAFLRALTDERFEHLLER